MIVPIVERSDFDNLLTKLLRTPPKPVEDVQAPGKLGKVIPPSQQSEQRKA